MMIHLLIDTCSLKQLISKSEINPDLLQLQKWVNNSMVQILCPDILMTEWIEHRGKESKGIDHRVRKISDQLRLFASNRMPNEDFAIWVKQLDLEGAKQI